MRNLTVGFVGLGLIGGSIAKAIRRVYPTSNIIAYNRSAEARQMSLSDGTCNAVTGAVDETFAECDYIFLCLPVELNIEYLELLRDIIKPECIITDVGSVKTNIHEAVIKFGMEKNFIGGHPMAGSEKTSYKAAKDRLIENAYYVITPTSQSLKEEIDRLDKFISKLGSITIQLDYKEHDKVVAAVSHLPHLIASSLVNLVKDSDSSEGLMKQMAAGGFKDITRIASSSPEMWEQICMTNRENLSDFIEKYVKSLLQIKSDIDTADGSAINELFQSSKEYRDTFSTSGGPIEKIHRIYCDIVDEFGAIATIATMLATNSISIKNIGIVHNREFQEGVLQVEFYDELSSEKAYAILSRYNYNVIS